MADLCQVSPLTVLVPFIPDVPLRDVVGTGVNSIALALGIINLLLATNLLSIIRLFQGLFLQPGLLLLRKRRVGYGQVYESLSKRPIDLAIVRVINEDTRKIVATRVTDSDGRFLAMLPKGRYRFTVNKPGYNFPTHFLAGDRFDPSFGPIFTAGVLEHATKGPLEVNLPIDGPEDRVTVKQALRRSTRRTVHAVLAFSGLILGAISTIFSWTWQAWLILGLHVISFLIFERLTTRPYGRPWGVVRDRGSRVPLRRSVVRILDTRFNRVLETTVADRQGEYSFIVGANQYRLFSDRPTHAPYRGNPFAVKERYGVVAQDIDMNRGLV